MARFVRLVSLVGLLALVLMPSMRSAQGASPTDLTAQATTEPGEEFIHFQNEKFPGLDARVGRLVPTQQQLEIVANMGATARWNQFGTPRTLIKYGDYLTTGLRSDNEVVIADEVRNWIRTNKALFRLRDEDVTNLALVHNLQFVGTDGQKRALLFEQRFDGVAAIVDGQIAVTFADGKIVYVSATTAAWDGTPLGSATLTPANAWRRAAQNVGRLAGVKQVEITGTQNGWTVLKAGGFNQPQLAQLFALPTPLNGIKLVYNTNVVDVRSTGEAFAYSHMIAAAAGSTYGQVLFRAPLMQHLDESLDNGHQTINAPQPIPQGTAFTGAFTPPSTCGVNTFAVPAGKTSIAVAATADVAANDIVLKLFGPLGDQLGESDTATSPEAVTFMPVGGIVPPGNYRVEVCPFAEPMVPLVAPFTYQGIFITDDGTVPTVPGGNPLALPKWKFFQVNPPINPADQFSPPTVDTRVIGCFGPEPDGVPEAGCAVELNLPGARGFSYDTSPRIQNAPTFTTLGNNVNEATSFFSPLTPSAPTRPVSPVRDYSYTWTNQWQENKCNPAVFATPQLNDADAAVANMFVLHNRMHDWSYALGFTEAAYNLQDDNRGVPPTNSSGQNILPNDPEIGNVQAGAIDGGSAGMYLGRDNANQITQADGTPGITNMYLWQPIAGGFYPPCVDGDYDMVVVGHEYGHAIQNRMYGGPINGLPAGLGASMGESWSDLTGMEFINGFGIVPENQDPFAVGVYDTGNNDRAIRNYNMSRSPLNYTNIEYDGNGTTSPHADGEIWSATNFDIRQALIEKYNAQFPASDRELQETCAEGRNIATACPGNRRWIQIFHDAFLISVGGAMDDFRDAYLAADMTRFGGANQSELRRAFARRGLGLGDAPADAVDSADRDPLTSFAAGLGDDVTLTFQAIASDQAGTPLIDAKLYVGVYEARVQPVADTDPSTPTTVGTAGNTRTLTNQATFVPDPNKQYEFLAVAPGYGAKRFTLPITAGASGTITIPMETNWASTSRAMSGGVTVTGNSGAEDKTLEAIADDTESTNYARVGTTTMQGNQINNTRVTVKLASGVHEVNRVQVSTASNPSGAAGAQGRFQGLRDFEVLTCNAAAGANCDDQNSFAVVYNSQQNGGVAFDAAAPRPAAPDMTLRSFAIPPTDATHVQIRVLENQCTGNPRFQGDQDMDPTQNPDCDQGTSGVPAAAALGGRSVRIAEFQVFAAEQGVVAPPVVVTPSPTQGPTVQPTEPGNPDSTPAPMATGTPTTGATTTTEQTTTTTAQATTQATTTATTQATTQATTGATTAPTTGTSQSKLYLPLVAR